MALEDISEYSALDATREEIRLLNLYPGNHEDPIILNFQVIQLEDKPELGLEAVSYKWGRPEGCHQIRVGGNAFFVSSSQNQMILDLRFPRTIRRLWIDALCINQRDVAERNSQVQLMRKIYSLARGVCIWLDHEIGWEDPSCQKLLTSHVSGNYLYTTGVKISVVNQVYRDLLDSDVGSVSGRQFFEEFRRIIMEARFPQDLTSKTRHLSYLLTRQIFSDDLPLDDDRFAEVGDDFQCLSDRILSPRDNDVFSESFLTWTERDISFIYLEHTSRMTGL